MSNEFKMDELCHFGIPGMKWGVRRFQNRDGTLTSSGKKRRANSEQARMEQIKSMDSKDLQDRINRLQLEQRYAQLTKPQASAGEKFVKEVLTNAAKQTATNYATKFMTSQADKFIEKNLKVKMPKK